MRIRDLILFTKKYYYYYYSGVVVCVLLPPINTQAHLLDVPAVSHRLGSA